MGHQKELLNNIKAFSFKDYDISDHTVWGKQQSLSQY